MAKITLASPVSDIRGKLGNVVFNKNKAGNYIQPLRIPSQPRTVKQTEQRAIFARFSSAYSALSSANKALWTTYAAAAAQELTDSQGNTYYASAKDWFIKINNRLERLGRTILSAAPTLTRPTAPTISSLKVTPSGSETNQATGGTATASSSNPLYPPADAFDEDTNTSWHSGTGGFPYWISYQLASPQIIRKLSLFPEGSAVAWMPNDFTIQGYDGSWHTLMTMSSFDAWTAGEYSSFSFENETAYSDYRVYVNACAIGASHVRIAEIFFFEGETDDSHVTYPEDEFSDDDLVLFIAMRNTDASAVAYPGYKETLLTQTPGILQSYFTDELIDIFGEPLEGRKWFAHVSRQDSEGQRSTAGTVNTLTFE